MNFTDEQIASIGTRLGLDLTGAPIGGVLRHSTSCDVQACPGSGKTSVLSAKLSLIAATWKATDKGICILSHTNVARHEIERRLRMTSEGRRLLKSPHFVGTIQSFVDRFLALPYIRSKGMTFDAIDDGRHARLAKKYFGEAKYIKARTWLSKRHLGMEVSDFAGDIEFYGSLQKIRHGTLTLPSESSDTYRNLLDVKRRVAAKGLFRYHDMFAVAGVYIDKFPWIALALRARFPIVFFDEVQDTSRLQCELLTRLFDRRTHLVQRFGDNDRGGADVLNSGPAFLM